MPLDEVTLDPLLRLALVRGVGPLRFRLLVERFGSADAVLRAGAAELARVPGIGAGLARDIAEVAGPAGAARARKGVAAMRRAGAIALTPDDPQYPAAFRVLADPPFLIFATGDLGLLERKGVAVVGTRAPSPYGRDVTAELSDGLARAGYSVVSGMARGIDTIAHRAALHADGATVGVLGHGIDQTYPPENRSLFASVRERGLLITEMPPGEKPLAGNFPRRNRLIAALSEAVLVVEMGLKSGAQHTVTFALELGKEILAVPGPIGSPTSAGTNQLIKDGARLVTSVEDVVEELGGVGTVPVPRTETARQRDLHLVSRPEERVLSALASGSRHVDDLAAALDLPAGGILSLLLELELKGLVEALPGKLYRRRLSPPLPPA